MSQISPPIRILLIGAVAFLAAWMLFLRPSDSAGPPAAATPTTAQPRAVDAGGQKAESLAGKAVEKANNAAAAQNAATNAVENATGEEATKAAGSGSATATTPAETGGTAPKLTDEVAKEGGLPLRVLGALADRKVVVLLFWSPKSPEDKAVRKALTRIDRHHNKVLAHATNVKKISSYAQITRGAEVEQSPTIVVVDRDREVSTLVGFVDRATIDQAVTDALRHSG
jgi:hypothetical protein